MDDKESGKPVFRKMPQYLLLGLLSVCAVLLINTVVSYNNINSLVASERWIEHSLQVQESLQSLLGAVTEAETAQRGYILTGNDAHLQAFVSALKHIDGSKTQLKNLVADNSGQTTRVEALYRIVDRKVEWMHRLVKVRQSGNVDQTLAVQNTGEGMWLMDQVRAMHAEIHADENRLLAQRNERAQRHLQATTRALFTFGIGGLLLTGLVFLFMRRYTRHQRRVEHDLHTANQMLQLVLDNIPQRIFWKDRESRFLGCSRIFAHDANLASPNDLIGKSDEEMPWRDNAAAYRADDEMVWKTNTAKLNYEERLPRSDGKQLWVRTSKVPLLDVKGHPIGILGTFEDITERKEAEHSLRLQASAMASSINGIFIVSAGPGEWRVEYVNPAFESITGRKASEVLGQNVSVLAPMNGKSRLEEIRATLLEKRTFRAVIKDIRADGSHFWNELSLTAVYDGNRDITHYVGIVNDVTDRIEYQRQVERQANFDALTGLPNRNLLQDRVKQAILHTERNHGVVGVALIDLDNFKYLNDSLGYQFGDALLKEVAERLQKLVRGEDTVARLGEDAFVLVLCGYDGEGTVASVVRRVLANIAEPIMLGERETRITCSIGVSIHSDGEGGEGIDGESLLRNADIAMYRAKEAGRNTFEIFHPDMTRRIHERLLLEQEMRKALERKEFLLQYQPQVDLGTGRILGAEALIRWQHPEQGMVSPARFIPVAEDSDLILTMGDWVLRTACRQAKAWHDAGLARIVVSVNVSVRQFMQPDFHERVAAALEESKLDPQCLELEMTESVLMSTGTELLAMLDRLKSTGVQLAIDDFGTGYSSLSYLKRLPVDKLKIDQSFVRDIPQDRNDMAIANAVIGLARSMDLTVIAEGVETREQLDFLRAQGCDEIQGYYFSRPVDPGVFAQMLIDGKAL